MDELTIGGVGVLILIVGIVEALKRYGLSTRKAEAVALGLGVVFVAVAYGLDQGLIPVVAAPYIKWGVIALFGGLAVGFSATGNYDLARKLFGQTAAEQ